MKIHSGLLLQSVANCYRPAAACNAADCTNKTTDRFALKRTIWIVLPCFLDSHSFRVVREQIRQQRLEVAFNARQVQFLLIDDSAGADGDLAACLDEDTDIIRCPFNLGHQRALVFGLRILCEKHEMEDEDFIITMDADGEDKPEDIPRLLSRLTQAHSHMQGPGLVLANRGRRYASFRFKIMYAGFQSLFFVLTGTRITSGNFCAMRYSVLSRVIFHPFFDQCFSSSLHKIPISREAIRCDRGRRISGQSQMGFSKLVAHGLRMLMPFLENIAARTLFVSAYFTVAALTLGIVCILQLILFSSLPLSLLILCLGISGVAIVSFMFFVLAFCFYSQSNAVLLVGIESKYGPATRGAS